MLGVERKKIHMPGVLTEQNVRARRDVRDLSFIVVALLGVVAFLAAVSILPWARLSATDAGYDISSSMTERSALLEKNRRLRIELMRLKSPERIEKIATEELGLVRPVAGQIVEIR